MSDTQIHRPTVFDRFMTPEPGVNYYHYCNSMTFLAIAEGGRLRFSDANMMNDGSEGRYGYALFERAANELLDEVGTHPALEGLTPEFFGKVDDWLSPKQLFSHPVIACFSRRPDVLSQWRAYADDGAGWAIGFSGEALNAMPVTMLDVVYDPDLQIREVRNHLVAMHLLARDGDEKTDLASNARLLASYLHAYKDPSFREEEEVRLLHELRVEIEETGWTLSDEGGTADGKAIDGEQVRFRAAGESIVAFVDIGFRPGAIREVWHGPRNSNGVGNVLFPLTQWGHRNVEVWRSASYYRG